VNYLNNFDKTDREYSPAPTIDPVRFGSQRSWSTYALR